MGLLKTYYKAKITEIEDKITSISGLGAVVSKNESCANGYCQTLKLGTQSKL